MGLFEQSTVEITDDLLDAYRNQVPTTTGPNIVVVVAVVVVVVVVVVLVVAIVYLLTVPPAVVGIYCVDHCCHIYYSYLSFRCPTVYW